MKMLLKKVKFINKVIFGYVIFLLFFSYSCEKDIEQNPIIIPENMDSSIVSQNGLLTVSGNKIVNKNNDPKIR